MQLWSRAFCLRNAPLHPRLDPAGPGRVRLAGEDGRRAHRLRRRPGREGGVLQAAFGGARDLSARRRKLPRGARARRADRGRRGRRRYRARGAGALSLRRSVRSVLFGRAPSALRNRVRRDHREGVPGVQHRRRTRLRADSRRVELPAARRVAQGRARPDAAHAGHGQAAFGALVVRPGVQRPGRSAVSARARGPLRPPPRARAGGVQRGRRRGRDLRRRPALPRDRGLRRPDHDLVEGRRAGAPSPPRSALRSNASLADS